MKILKQIKNYRNIVENFSYLSILQITTMLLPLVTYPYVIRVVGSYNYGVVVYAQTVALYFMVFVKFGFDIIATREVSMQRENIQKLREIVSSVYIIKFIFLLFTSILFLGYYYYYLSGQGTKIGIMYCFCFLVCLNDFLFPTWYFQGVEKMKYITVLSVFGRVISLILIFLFIRKENDFWFLPLLNSIGALVVAVIASYIVFVKEKVGFSMQKYSTLKIYVKESFPIFLSSVSTQIYVNANKIIIGNFLGMKDVAYYDLADKIVTLLKTPQLIANQSIFPHVSKTRSKSFVKKIFKYSAIVNLGLYIGCFVLSGYFIFLIGGEEMMPAVPILRILALNVPIIALSGVLIFLLLLPFNYQKISSVIIVSSGILYVLLILLFWMLNIINIYTISFIVVILEFFIFVSAYFYSKKKSLL